MIYYGCSFDKGGDNIMGFVVMAGLGVVMTIVMSLR